MGAPIAYILKRFPRLSQTFVLSELLALRRLGAELCVIALRRSDEPAGRYAELDAPVHYLSDMGVAPGDRASEVAAATEIVRRSGAGHIHAHFATRAAAVARAVSDRTGAPFSFTAHAHDIFHADVDRAALAELIERARFVVTVSDYNRRYLEMLQMLEGRGGQIIRSYNSADLRALRPAAGPREAGLIVGVGRLIAKKGFTHLIEAVRLLRGAGVACRCEIVGEGEERPALERQIAAAQLGAHVRLLGALPPPQAVRAIGAAAAFALPCVIGDDGDRDGMPTVLLEAMALGTPVVSTDVAGIPELVQHGRTGLLVPEADPLSLARALAQLLDDAPLRRRLSAAALAHVRAEFDLETNAGRLLEAFTNGREARWAGLQTR